MLAEAGNVTLPHVPFSSISDPDIVDAFVHCEAQEALANLSIEEMLDAARHVFPRWDEERIVHLVDQEQPYDAWLMVLLHLLRPYIKKSRRRLGQIAQLREIPITRRFERVPDLNKPLGVHWAYGKQALVNNAEDQWFGKNIIYGTVRNDRVDWRTTLARNLLWWFQREITPVRGSLIKIIRIDYADGSHSDYPDGKLLPA